MSATMAEIEASSKKRKHEDDSKKAKKKRKQVDADVAEVSDNNVVDGVAATEITSKSSKKEKKTKPENPERPSKKSSKKTADLNIRPEPQSQSDTDTDTYTDTDAEAAAATSIDKVDDRDMQDVSMLEIDAIQPELEPEEIDHEQLDSMTETAFHSVRMSLYIPLTPSGVSKALSSLLAVHVAPLLLTYFPPAGGVILGYSDPVLSARPQSGPTRPLLPPVNGSTDTLDEEVGSKLGDEFAASWVWLTLTFLVFKPSPGEELQGFTNAQSQGFLGLVSYNYFQSSISKSRLPKTWSWDGPTRETHKKSRKGKLNDSNDLSQDTMAEGSGQEYREDDAIDGFAGAFVDKDGEKVPDKLKFRVVDLEIISAQERGQRFALQIEGTLLDEADEQQVRNEERQKWEQRKAKSNARPGSRSGTPTMSGGLGISSRASSVISIA